MRPLVEEDRGIRSDREEGGRAEVHVTRVAAEDVPGGGEDHELQHRIRGGEPVVVRKERPRTHQQQRDGEGGEREARSAHRPKSPEGLIASVASSKPNDTAGAQEGPSKVDVNDSARPRMKAPASVPRI